MEVIESVNLRNAKYIYSLCFNEFKKLIPRTVAESAKIDKKDKIQSKLWNIKAIYRRVRELCRGFIKNDGKMRRLYSYTGAFDAGRLYCFESIQSSPAEIRGLLMRDHTTDIDMVNAGCTTLRWLCKRHNIPTPNLDYYINNRDEVLKSIDSDRTTAKKKIIAVMNREKRLYGEKNKFMLDFDKEMKDIQCKLKEIDEFKGFFDDVPEEKRKYNWNGTAISRINCHWENKILMEIIAYLLTRSITTEIPAFDGCIVSGNFYGDSQLLTDIESHINDKFNGLNLKLSYKHHDTSIQVPDNFDDSVSLREMDTKDTEIPELPEDWIEVDGTDQRYAEIFAKKCQDYVIYQDKNWYVLQYPTKIWKIVPHINNEISTMLTDIIKQHAEYTMAVLRDKLNADEELDEKDKNKMIQMEERNLEKMHKYVGSTTGSNSIEKKCMRLLTRDPVIIWDNVPEILAFPDGTCLNLNTKEFEEIQPHYYVSKTCNVSVNDELYQKCREGQDEIYNKLNKNLCDTVEPYEIDIEEFTDKEMQEYNAMDDKQKQEYNKEIAKNHIGYCFKRFSRCLYGRNVEETYDELVGKGGNGKSNLTALYRSALGSYVREINPEQFTKPIKDSTTANSGLVSCIGTRLVICSEPQERDKVQASTLKKWTGNDQLQARALFKDEITFEPTFCIMIQSNHTLSFDSTDGGVRRRRRIMRFQKSYVSEDVYNAFTNDNRPKWIEKGDSTLKNKFRTPEYGQRFLCFLIRHYFNEHKYTIPRSFSNEAEDSFTESNPIGWFIEECCDLSDRTAVISPSDLYDHYKSCCIQKEVPYITNTSFGTQMKKISSIEFKRTSTTRRYIGIKPAELPQQSSQSEQTIQIRDDPLDN